MKRHVAVAALLATLVGVTLSHVEWKKADNGHLLLLDGRPLDVIGWMQDQANRLRRDCTQVTRLQPPDTRLASALAVIQSYSPPASHTGRVKAAWASGQWLLAEVAFDDLLPAVVLLQAQGQSWAVAPMGIWSGETHPWRAAPLIRAYLERQVRAAPAPLLACFDPSTPSLTAPAAGAD